jgi:hypothetical protein
VAVIKSHITEFSSTTTLDAASGYIGRLIKEATKLGLLPRNFIRDRGFNFSQSCYLVTNMIKQCQDEPIQRQEHNKLMTVH